MPSNKEKFFFCLDWALLTLGVVCSVLAHFYGVPFFDAAAGWSHP